MEAKVDFMEEITVTETTRKRWKKIIGHLPLSTAFHFCDIDLTGLVSEGTLASFAEELEWRKKKCEKRKKEQGDSSVQKKGPEPSAWEVELSEMPEEIRIALEGEPKAAMEESPEKEEAKVTMGKKEKMEDGEAKKAEPENKQAQKSPQEERKPRKKPAPEGAAGMPSFLQVLNNTVPVPLKQNGPDTTNGGTDTTRKGRAKKQKQLFSNNSSRRY